MGSESISAGSGTGMEKQTWKSGAFIPARESLYGHNDRSVRRVKVPNDGHPNELVHAYYGECIAKAVSPLTNSN